MTKIQKLAYINELAAMQGDSAVDKETKSKILELRKIFNK